MHGQRGGNTADSITVNPGRTPNRPWLRAIVLAGGLLSGTACEKAAPPVDRTAMLRQAEQQASSRLFAYPRVVLSGQLDSMLTFWTSDVRVFESETRLVGDSVLRARDRQFHAAFDVTRLAYAPTETVAHDSDSVVYQFGYFTEDVRRKRQTAVTNTGNNFAARMIRDSAGSWRFQRFLATPAPRPSAPTPTVQSVAPATGVRPDAPAIEQRMQAYTAALRSNNAMAILGFWADDGRYLQPNVELNDKPAIARFVNDAYAKGRSTAADITSEEIFLHDGVAYQLGSCSPCLVPGSTGPHNYIARWKRSGEGQWLLDRFLATLAPRTN